jgi:hypothetical protein
MSDHADGRAWTITRLLYSTQLPFLLICTAVFAGAVLVLTFGIDLWVTITESVWDPAVSVVRWFAFGYGLYLVNRQLPLYVAAGRTRRELLGSVALFVAGAGAVLAALLTLGFALEGVLYRAMGWPQGVGFERLYDGPGQFPLVFVSYWAMLLVWTTIGLLLAAGFYRSGGSAPAAVLLALAMVVVTGYGIGFNGLPFVGTVVDVADVPLAGTVALCLAGLLPGAAATWALVRDVPICNP